MAGSDSSRDSPAQGLESILLVLDPAAVKEVFPGVSTFDFLLAILAAVQPKDAWEGCRVSGVPAGRGQSLDVEIGIEGAAASEIGESLAAAITDYEIPVDSAAPGSLGEGARQVAVVAGGLWVAPE